MIELVAAKVETADQCMDCTVAWIDRDQCRFHFRQLRNLPESLGVLLNPD